MMTSIYYFFIILSNLHLMSNLFLIFIIYYETNIIFIEMIISLFFISLDCLLMLVGIIFLLFTIGMLSLFHLSLANIKAIWYFLVDELLFVLGGFFVWFLTLFYMAHKLLIYKMMIGTSGISYYCPNILLQKLQRSCLYYCIYFKVLLRGI